MVLSQHNYENWVHFYYFNRKKLKKKKGKKKKKNAKSLQLYSPYNNTKAPVTLISPTDAEKHLSIKAICQGRYQKKWRIISRSVGFLKVQKVVTKYTVFHRFYPKG